MEFRDVGEGGTVAGDEFSELLGRLKERSGLSYGVLGKRLHTSTSTLHRYVNGDAVPTDYAPVERFARLCKATPEELVELHRRWVLADARRRQKASAPDMTTGPGTTAESATTESDTVADTAADADPEVDRPASAEVPVARRRRTAVLAGAAVVAALVSAALVVNLVAGDGDDDRDGKRSVGAASRTTDSVGERTPGASGSADAKGRSASPSASPSGGPTVSSSASPRGSGGVGAAEGGGVEDGATAPNVAVNPYQWEGPCSQHYLIDREPERVPPPPTEQDARGWVSAFGGVAAGQQMLAVTLQGTGKATVVLDALHVRVVEKSAPLAWNDFAMGVGCGGGVETTSFTVDLDAGRPAVSTKAGQRDFPYKVSESDPEVFYVFADARAHNVSWYLELDWSSGGRQGTVRIDDEGKPFRTSGNVGRPAYDYPLGSSEWGRNEYEPNIPG
ncbi:helix-turn-helix transcriptional regulator [Streptomyces sp. cf386]|uniref:helix-turn-helix domain-containing protein n=1 Tax=Streptomyces sp. cf386 TaxID=1761904 RepID=UPI000B87C12D|nr:helix-turn-helix transcriptional regulator [Streptomyces sp. cf386]